MNSTINITNKLNALAAQRIAVVASPSGTLQVRPASRLTADDREWLREHTGAILAHLRTTLVADSNITLSGNEPWDTQVALMLMRESDALVEQLGVDGRHPAVADAAAMVSSAAATHDLETLRFAVAEFTTLIRRLADERVSAAKPR
jgi:hypothetical protein